MNDTPMDRTDPERLISRIVDGEATPRDWTAFRLQADHEPSLWRDLAEAQRTQGELADDVSAAISIAGRVDVPIHSEMVRRLGDRVRVVGMWGGWLAAACVGLMWARFGPALPETGGSSQASLTPVQALRQYLNQGQTAGSVLGELPEKLLVQARPMTDSDGRDIGGYEVVYLRQILERTVVKDLYRFGADDAGRLQPVRLDVKRQGRPM